ncbi:MAG: hypothetical protein ACRDLA_11320 [Thermoleophilaceae bacterium]
MVARLRRSYSVALAFARDLPGLGRCLVEIERPGEERKKKRRWVARFPARLYVETHVRSQLDHLISCLRDEMMDPTKEDRLRKIVSTLEDPAAGLTSWKRVKALFLRLPPVAAALPVIVTAAANPLSGIERGDLVDAGAVMLGSSVFAYGLFVWPSLKLGFRVKRAIFSGGVDLAYPFSAKPGTATWTGPPLASTSTTGDIVEDFAGWRARRRARPAAEEAVDQPPLAFPHVNVYRDENALFGHLGRRKHKEAPIDLVLSLRPYLTTLAVALIVVSYVGFVVDGGLAEDPEQLFLAPIVILLSLVPIQVIWQLRANVWRRRRHWEVEPGRQKASSRAPPA